MSFKYSKEELDRIWHLYDVDKVNVTTIAKRLGRTRKSVGEQIIKKKKEML